jgi:predicted TIM-barrel fold metal-dependent hydrolase
MNSGFFPTGAAETSLNICECHVHVIAPLSECAMVDDRHYTPPPAPVEQLRAHMAHVGASRAVIVQPSVYGTDNTVMLDALDRMNGSARGIAVLPPNVGREEIAALDALGVRGIRLNLESSASQDLEFLRRQLDTWGATLAEHGWHIQVYAAFDVHLAMLDRYDVLPVPVVLDHYAMTPARYAGSDASLARLLASLQRGNVYVKLSASYRLPGGSDAAVALARTLIAANPDRLVWASDWPHTNREPGKAPSEISRYRQIPVDRLIEERAALFADPVVARKVLSDNAAGLYRF